MSGLRWHGHVERTSTSYRHPHLEQQQGLGDGQHAAGHDGMGVREGGVQQPSAPAGEGQTTASTVHFACRSISGSGSVRGSNSVSPGARRGVVVAWWCCWHMQPGWTPRRCRFGPCPSLIVTLHHARCACMRTICLMSLVSCHALSFSALWLRLNL